MRRVVTTLSVLAVVAAVPAAAGATTYGISDQNPATFTNPLYKPLKLKVARYIAPYDVMDNANAKAGLTAWIAAATAVGHQKVLLSVEHSRTPGKESTAPSTADYTAEITKIKAAFNPMIESFSSWNEVDVCQKGGRLEGQPTKICSAKTGPKIVAGYYKAAKKVFSGKKIVGLDILDGATKGVLGNTKNYIKRFRAAGGSSNKYWGLHNYSDTNRYSDSLKRTKTLLPLFGKGQVWLTETGGQLALNGKKTPESKAAKAVGCMIQIAKRYKQISRVYVYQFNGGNSTFDAGLIDPGATTAAGERDGYKQLQKRKAYACKK